MIAELDAADEDATAGARLGGARLELYALIERWVGRTVPGLGVRSTAAAVEYLHAGLYRRIHIENHARLTRQVEAFRDFQTRQPDQAASLAGLQQSVEAAQQLLVSIDQDIRRLEMGIAAGMSDIGYRLEMRRDPIRPTFPVEPNKPKLAMMGAVLALALGAGLVILAEMFDRSFKTIPQIEATLGVPVLGSLPSVEDGMSLQRPRRVMLWLTVIAGIIVVAAAGFFWLYPRLAG